MSDKHKTKEQLISELEAMRRRITEEEQGRLLLEAASEAIVIVDEAGRIVLVNAGTEEMFGYHRHELIGQTVEILVPEYACKIHLEHRANYLAQPRIRPMGLGLDLGGRRKDGTEFPIEIGLSYVEGEKGLLVMGVIANITSRHQTEAALRDSEARYRLLADHSTDMISRHTPDGVYLYASPACRTLLGYEPEELVGHSAYEFFHPEDLAAIQKSHSAIIEQPDTYTVSYRIRCKDGDYIWFETTSRTVRNPETGAVQEIIAVSRDTTRRKQAEQELRETQYFLQATLDALSAHIAILDIGGAIIAVNQAWRRYAEANDFVGTDYGVGANYLKVCDTAAGEGTEGAREAARGIREVMDKWRNEFTLEYPCHNPEEEHWFILHVTRFEGSGLARVVVAHEDITQRKQVERALQKARDELEVKVAERTAQLSRANAQLQVELAERKQVEAALQQSTKRLTILHKLDLAIASSLRQTDVYHAFAQHVTRLLSYDWMFIALLDGDEIRVTYATSENGKNTMRAVGSSLSPQTTAIGRVIQQGQPLLRHKIAANVRFAEDEQLIAEGIQSSMAVPLRFRGRVIGAWNIASRQVGAYGPDELEMAQSMAAQLAISIENARLYEQAKQEISERQQVEETLRESEARYRGLVESQQDLIFRVDPAGCFTFVNDAYCQKFGRQCHELIGQDSFATVHQDDLPALFEVVQTIERPPYRVNFELRADTVEGWRQIAWESYAIRDEQGQIIEIQGVGRDLTEQKELEEQFRQAQKMESVGRLAGGVAHDFNNVLTVITGYSELLLHRYGGEDGPLRRYLEEINQAGIRAAGLTRQLLAFSRQQVLEPKVVDLSALLVNLEKMLRHLIGEDIDLVTRLQPELSRVKIDPGQFEQVIMNLVVNARDAMPQGGELTIETATVELGDEDDVRRQLEMSPGSYVMLTVSDTGTGMDKKTMAKIFDPFFTTKEEGKGTGLGLSTVHGIIKQSGGHIRVYSEPGRGTAFKIYLPQIEETLDASRPELVSVESFQGTETILLVEDETAVRALVREVLQRYGYTVLEAEHGVEALQVGEQHLAPIHLLLTDVVLSGGISGPDLAERLTSLRPKVKTLYMSGYTHNATAHHRLLESHAACIQKPFTPDALAGKVRAVLDSPRQNQDE